MNFVYFSGIAYVPEQLFGTASHKQPFSKMAAQKACGRDRMNPWLDHIQI